MYVTNLTLYNNKARNVEEQIQDGSRECHRSEVAEPNNYEAHTQTPHPRDKVSREGDPREGESQVEFPQESKSQEGDPWKGVFKVGSPRERKFQEGETWEEVSKVGNLRKVESQEGSPWEGAFKEGVFQEGEIKDGHPEKWNSKEERLLVRQSQRVESHNREEGDPSGKGKRKMFP